MNYPFENAKWMKGIQLKDIAELVAEALEVKHGVGESTGGANAPSWLRHI